MESNRQFRKPQSKPNEIVILSPGREAAFFYGLYQKRHSLATLRDDIDVPADVIADWLVLEREEPIFHDALRTMLPFRKNVLRIFNSMVMEAHVSGTT